MQSSGVWCDERGAESEQYFEENKVSDYFLIIVLYRSPLVKGTIIDRIICD